MEYTQKAQSNAGAIALVLGAFHKEYVLNMREVAYSTAEECGLHFAEERWVPGSMEKPLALKRLLLRNDIAGAVVLGVIERGETKHGFVMGSAVTQKILDLQLELMKPIGMGILGPEIDHDQIPARLRPYARGAVLAVHAMLKEQEADRS